MKEKVMAQGKLQGLKADSGVPIVFVLSPIILALFSLLKFCSICFWSSIADIWN